MEKHKGITLLKVPPNGNTKRKLYFQITFLPLRFLNSLNLRIECVAVTDMLVPLGLGRPAPTLGRNWPQYRPLLFWASAWNHSWAKRVWLSEVRNETKQDGYISFKATQYLS